MPFLRARSTDRVDFNQIGAHRSALLHVLTKKKGVKISDLEEVAYPLLGMETAKHTKGVKGKAAQSGDDERPKKKKAAAAAAEERPRKKKKGDRDG
jgi:hypothetical protein